MALTIRPLLARDKSRVLEICARTWSGWDYVPLFFDRWVQEGSFWAGEVRGRIVGFGKATELAPGEWWLEGLRVDRPHRSRGIGTELSFAVLYEMFRIRPVSLRLATAEINDHSIRIIDRLGFEEMYRTTLYQGKPMAAKPGPGLVRPKEDEALRFIEQTDEIRTSHGLLAHTWLFRRIDLRYVKELVRRRRIHSFQQGTRIEGLAVLGPHRYRPEDLEISLLSGTTRARRALAAGILSEAARLGSERISGFAASPAMRQAFAQLGMTPHPTIGETIVYEYPI